jgi:hypothetical protein
MEGLIGLLINLLVLLLVLGIVYWIASLIIGAMGLPAPALQIVQVIMLLILLLYVLAWFGGAAPHFYSYRVR